MSLPQSLPVARIVDAPAKTKATALKVIGMLLMVLGVPGCMYGAEVNHDRTMGFWFFATGVGLVLFVWGRFSE